jgi:hypothetical protein
MIQVTDPIRAARITNPAIRARSMIVPETIDAAVQAKSRNAAQKTPLMRSDMFGPISSAHGRANSASSSRRPPLSPGPLVNAL